MEPISKLGFWFKIAAGPSFKPQVRLRRIEDLKRGTHPAEKAGRPKDIFETEPNINLTKTQTDIRSGLKSRLSPVQIPKR